MIVRRLEDVRSAGNEIKSDGWTSRRYLLGKDNMGFSFHETIIEEGASLNMWYKNHLEAVFCVKGRGVITELDTNKKHLIEPGTMYALDKNDRHLLEGVSEMTVICAFNPPVTGQEIHDKDGSYELAKEKSNK